MRGRMDWGRRAIRAFGQGCAGDSICHLGQSVSRVCFRTSQHVGLVRTRCPLLGAWSPAAMSTDGKEKGRITETDEDEKKEKEEGREEGEKPEESYLS